MKNANSVFFFQYIGTQIFAFVVLLAGSAVLLDNSARDSNFQPRIRESMRQLIMNAQYEEARSTLAMIQEGVSILGIRFSFVLCFYSHPSPF